MNESDRKLLIQGAAVTVLVTIIGLAFVWAYVGGLHQPKFHKVPIAVLGPPALTRTLNSQGQFKVTHVDSQQAAINRIDDRKADGGIIVGLRGINVLLASAA